MSEEIFINTGTSFQQQYTARQPAIGTSPTTAQYDAQGNASQQSPFTYSNRTPFTYRNPVSGRQPYIANGQQPYPYIAHKQTPYIANRQNPYPYPANAQQPYPYAASDQQTYAYQANQQTPFTYQARTPFPYAYQASDQQPVIASQQTPFTYARQAQQPYAYPANSQSPFTYARQAQQPYAYPANGQQPGTYQAQGRQPVIRNRQNPYPYPANAQTTARQPINVQTPLGSNVYYDPQDKTTSGNNTWQLTASGQTTQYIAQRQIGTQFYLQWYTGAGNGYYYAYWRIRRNTTTLSSPELTNQQAGSKVYLQSGTVDLAGGWQIIELWVFTDSNYPDSIDWDYSGLSNHKTTSGATTSLPLTCNSSGGDVVSERNDTFECEENWSVPGSGTRISTITVRPRAIKSNYTNLTGGTHVGEMEGTIGCNWNGCFPAGTKVLLEDNTTKNIEDMQVGDAVIGKDGIINAVKVMRTHTFTNKAMYTINGGLITTGGHPILTTDGWKSCNASEGQEGHPELNITELAEGDTLLKDVGNANGDTVEESVSTITVNTDASITVYNLDVTDSPSGNDTYVVNNYIVHNK